jgi:peptidoglycan/xylan/chitin deacetylase (PgdA/CDA1 family)
MGAGAPRGRSQAEAEQVIPSSRRITITSGSPTRARLTTWDPEAHAMNNKRLATLIIAMLALSLVQATAVSQRARALLPSFARSLVSVTLDDTWESQYANGLPSMVAHNVKGTVFTVTSFVDSDPTRMTTANLQAFQAAGNEIGSHQVDHVDPTTLTPAQLTYQLTASKAWLEARFGPVYDYASPFGTYDATTIAAIQKYYL